MPRAMTVRLVTDIQNRLFWRIWRIGTGRAPERCIPLCGMESGIPGRAAIGRLSSACRASSSRVDVDGVVLIAATYPSQQEQCLKPVDLPGRARAKEGVPSRMIE